MIYCKDNKELHLSGTADLLLAQATAVAINVLKVACAGRKDEMRKEIVEKFVELVVKDVCGEKSKVSDGNCLIKVENGMTTKAGNAKDILEALEICVSVVVKTLAGEDEDKAGSLVCEFIARTKPITYPVQPSGGYLIFVYNYGSAAVFLVRGEYSKGFVHRLAPVNDRNAFSCKWENSALTITSSDDASATVSIIRLY